MVHGQMVQVNGLMLIKHKSHMQITSMMEPSSSQTQIFTMLSTISKLIMSMMIGLTLIMKLLGIHQQEIRELSPSQLRTLKRCLYKLISMIIECMLKVAKVNILKEH